MAKSNSQDGSNQALQLPTSVSPSTAHQSPTENRRRRAIRRSITERTPPTLHFQHHFPQQQQQQQSTQATASSSRLKPQAQDEHRHRHHYHHRKQFSQDVRSSPMGLSKHLVRHSLDLPRSAGVTPIVSPTQSRRGSVLNPKDEESRAAGSYESKMSQEEALREAQRKAELRADGLKQSLTEMHTFSANAAKRLDDTYYSVLEKMSALQETITTLTELADTSHEIYGTFEKESQGLEHEIVTQIGSIGRFEEQQGRIESLQGRIEHGREKISGLGERLELVREKVEGWDLADREWQEKTRKRMKVVWSTTMIVVMAVISIFLVFKSSAGDAATNAGLAAVNSAGHVLKEAGGLLPNVSRIVSRSGDESIPEVEDEHSNADNLAELQDTLDRRRRVVDTEGLRALDEL